MRRSTKFQLLLLLVIFLSAIAFLAISTRENHEASASSERREARVDTASSSSTPQLPGRAVPNSPAPADKGAPPLPLAAGTSRMDAYRFAVREGVVSLDAVEPVQGEFRRRRGPLPWQPGMWCVRLLDADLKALAQDTLAAPDAVCVVLDPHVRDEKGAPKASQLAGTGDAMVQVRMPPMPQAKWVKVYRVAGSEAADLNTEPLGQLLASIALP